VRCGQDARTTVGETPALPCAVGTAQRRVPKFVILSEVSRQASAVESPEQAEGDPCTASCLTKTDSFFHSKTNDARTAAISEVHRCILGGRRENLAKGLDEPLLRICNTIRVDEDYDLRSCLVAYPRSILPTRLVEVVRLGDTFGLVVIGRFALWLGLSLPRRRQAYCLVALRPLLSPESASRRSSPASAALALRMTWKERPTGEPRSTLGERLLPVCHDGGD
jgi:hypothetical protein